MELTLQKVGIINKSTVKLNGLTIICGSNNSGKSTIGKALYATIESLSNLDEKWHNELLANYRRALFSISRMLDLDSVSRYVDFERMQVQCNKDFSMLLRMRYRYHNSTTMSIVDMFEKLKEAVEFLHPNIFFEFLKKSKSDLPKKFYAFLDNFEENRKKALAFLDDFTKYYFDSDLQDYAEKSISSLFAAEFKNQIYPVYINSKEKNHLF